MTFQQFNRLSAVEQEIAVWYIGVAVADRIEGDIRYLLFQLDSFYIEITYVINLNSITRILAFDDMELLEPYLANIQIELD
ncbi:MAG: hypothetical protein ACTHMV_17340 [Chitinophagaceae bacterium]